MVASANQYDTLHTGRLPVNPIQAQRDYFGAHTYDRADKQRGDFFYTEWSQAG